MGKSTLVISILAIGLVIVSLLMAYSVTQPTTITIPTAGAELNTISVTGQGEMTVAPDKAEVYIKIETVGNTAEEAQSENRIIEKDVLLALRKAGVRNEDMETTSYYLNPRYRWDGKKNEILSYTQFHTLKIETENIDTIGDIIDTAVEAGANGVQNVKFDLTKAKREEVNQEVLGKAAEKAKEKAVAITDGLNVKLGKVARVSESNYYYRPYAFTEMATTAMGRDEGPAPKTQIMPRDLEVSASITVTYLIE